MAGRESSFLAALDRSEAKKDGGFNNNWSFDQSEESDGDTEKDEANLLSVDESDGTNGSDEQKSKLPHRTEPLKNSSDSLKTFERQKIGTGRPKGNAIGLNMLGAGKKTSENSQSSSISSGTVVQGRRFQFANMPSMKTAAQRKEYPSNIQNFPKIEIEHIILTCPQDSENISKNKKTESEPEIKRKVKLKRQCDGQQADPVVSPALKKSVSQSKGVEPSEPVVVCRSCGKRNENQTGCSSCGRNLREDVTRQPKPLNLNESPGPLSRAPIRTNSVAKNALNVGFTSQHFYGPVLKTPVDIILTPAIAGGSLVQTNGRVELLLTASRVSRITRSTRQAVTRPLELNDPIVLSSDEDDDEDNASTGSTNRTESISPRPADSARSSPAPSTGKVEAALTENTPGAQQTDSSFIENEVKVTIPRKARMKDQFGNAVPDVTAKRRKVTQHPVVNDIYPQTPHCCESIILNCRCVRIGTLRRMVSEPVIFCLDYIKICLGGMETSEIHLLTSEITKCEWCSARKLPVLFLQTIPAACLSLQKQLKMNKEKNTAWYDCKGTNPEEQYIILIFENGLDVQGTVIFEKIISDIAVRNNIPDFLVKIPFDEANSRLVANTKTMEENTKGSPIQKETRSGPETRMQVQNITAHLQFFDDEDEVGESHTAFTGPIEKLIVYPPPPAKCGISVTNEDLHCLNEGEFLNDVIIDFYLKYLVLEKLKKEDADRIHVFSSFFYKRLNQRERRSFQDTVNLSLQQRRHGRVKTWTRHVDLFQKDYVFVPINEAAHWFLAVICFPGLEGPIYEPNPVYDESAAVKIESSTAEEGNSSGADSQSEEEQSCSAKKAGQNSQKTPSKVSNCGDRSAGCENKDTERPCTRRNPCTGKNVLKKTSISKVEEEMEMEASACQKADDRTKDEKDIQSKEPLTPIKPKDGLHRIRLSYCDDSEDTDKAEGEDTFDFSEDPDNQDDSSNDGGLADDTFNSESGQWHLQPTICKQPCILIMDSLRGPSRSNVVKTLREYLEVEWEVRKGNKRSFNKDLMKGSNPRVPQQDNFSDCGVYILQYVESFFENPIPSFDLPMNLVNWFPQQRMKKKREEIRDVILKLQQQQSKEKKGHKDLSTTDSSAQEGSDQLSSSSN
ncbi:sentrin-specific protease 6 isoform X2 [Latimeria chalumnae]|uniref:sentrin-specific protease 6 isoform X2 n=1 Tax=Latimeria chalumnae TaxID=7897 RepID=UPI0006D91DA2|nr:PREDICTED: sentrin-specific protease 6 isoform X2 [Latimeria chalumnae]|eukprot:XP_006002472.2 PREDICTED: sentrin-specific protease 6 isoform X2 [Latimeria chalumnae]